MKNPLGQFASGWRENKYKRLVELRGDAQKVAAGANMLARKLGQAINVEYAKKEAEFYSEVKADPSRFDNSWENAADIRAEKMREADL